MRVNIGGMCRYGGDECISGGMSVFGCEDGEIYYKISGFISNEINIDEYLFILL